MFLLLQFIGAAFIILGIWFVYGKLLRKDTAMVMGLCAVGILSAVLSGVLLTTIPMPAETVYIEAVNGAVALKNVSITDGKTHTIFELAEGNWQFEKKGKVFRWSQEASEKDPSMTERIAVKVPIGAGRRLVFLADENSGCVAVSYGEERKEYNLYSAEEKDRKIWIPDSNAIYDDLVKLGRLAVYGVMTVCGVMLAAFFLSRVRGKRLWKALCGACAVLTAMSFYLRIDLVDRSGDSLSSLLLDFFRSFRTDELILPIIIALLLYKAFFFCIEIYCENYATAKGTACIATPAAVFSSFMVMGHAFVSNGTLRPIFGSGLQVLKGLFLWLGYFPLFFFGIVWVFHYLESHSVCGNSSASHNRFMRAYEAGIKRRPFALTMLLLMAAYLPVLIISYPGIITEDSVNQISQIFGYLPLANDHPVAHTALMGVFLRAGNQVFGDINAGLFLYTVAQVLFVLAAVSLTVKFLASLQVSPTVLLFLTLYFMLCPQIHEFSLVIIKGMISSVFLMAFMVMLSAVLTKKRNRHQYVLLGLANVGVILFRHENRYVILLTVLLLFFLLREHRRLAVLLGAGSLCFILLWDHAVLPHFTSEEQKYEPGIEKVFMGMQTARYLRDAGDEVTEEEMEVLSAIFNIESMQKEYTPDDLADGVFKSIIVESVEDWNAYRKIWFQMFLKHPEIYAAATLESKYEYLYPKPLWQKRNYVSSWSEQMMDSLNKRNLEGVNGEFKYPASLSELRNECWSMRAAFFKLPLVNLLCTTSIYFWIMFIWLAYCIFKKDKLSIITMGPLLFLVLMLLAGPSNGSYYRYTCPYFVGLFVVILLGLVNSEGNKRSSSLKVCQ